MKGHVHVIRSIVLVLALRLGLLVMGRTDAVNDPSQFNEDVAATAVVGALATKVDIIDKRTERIEAKVDKVVTTTDRWGGALVVIGAAVSAVVSLIVGVVTAMVGGHQ